MAQRRRRHARPRNWMFPTVIVILALVVSVAAGVLASVAASRRRASVTSASPAAGSENAPAPSPSASHASSPSSRPMAVADRLTLMVPVAHPVLVGYHEASYPDALQMAPLGRLVRNYNRTKFDAPLDSTGPRYIVEASRGRKTSATSAADVVARRGAEVTAPVTGTVVKAHPYKLYGRYRDWYVVIAPDGRPDLGVVMIHLDGVEVQRGDRVSATLSVIGRPRVFPFESEVDYYVRGRVPHIHVEVKRVVKKEPGAS